MPPLPPWGWWRAHTGWDEPQGDPGPGQRALADQGGGGAARSCVTIKMLTKYAFGVPAPLSSKIRGGPSCTRSREPCDFARAFTNLLLLPAAPPCDCDCDFVPASLVAFDPPPTPFHHTRSGAYVQQSEAEVHVVNSVKSVYEYGCSTVQLYGYGCTVWQNS